MTDREKLIELLKTIPQVNHAQAAVEGLDYVFGNAADHLIANGVTVQRWIPVTERLPKEWVRVLVLSRCGFCEVAVYLGNPGKWRVTWNHDLLEVDSITHWMPLPEPPKGE